MVMHILCATMIQLPYKPEVQSEDIIAMIQMNQPNILLFKEYIIETLTEVWAIGTDLQEQ